MAVDRVASAKETKDKEDQEDMRDEFIKEEQFAVCVYSEICCSRANLDSQTDYFSIVKHNFAFIKGRGGKDKEYSYY